jgi:hypothetical protein
MSRKQVIIACAITAVLAGGVGYVGGIKMSSLRRMSPLGNRGGDQMINFRNGGNAQNTGRSAGSAPNMMIRGGAVTGEVTAKDDKSMTVKMSDGSSRIVILSDKTTYRISEESSIEKIAVGTKIAVFGESGTDGSVTAASIEINPAMMGQTIKQ